MSLTSCIAYIIQFTENDETINGSLALEQSFLYPCVMDIVFHITGLNNYRFGINVLADDDDE